jgi:hypothetical protein
VTRAHAPHHSPFLLALEEAIAMARDRAHNPQKNHLPGAQPTKKRV